MSRTRGQRADDGVQMTDGRRRTAEDGWQQRTDDGGQRSMAEGAWGITRGQTTDSRKRTNINDSENATTGGSGLIH